MKFYSEKTDKFYKSIEECKAAEKEFDIALAKKEKEKSKKEAAKKVAYEKVEAAFDNLMTHYKSDYEVYVAALKEYRELCAGSKEEVSTTEAFNSLIDFLFRD